MKLRQVRKNQVNNDDNLLLPVLSLLTILIPFLITNLAFFHLRAIEASVPGPPDPTNVEQPRKNRILNVIGKVDIGRTGVKILVVNEDTGETLNTENLQRNKEGYDLDGVGKQLIAFRQRYRNLTTLLIDVEPQMKMSDVVALLDRCRTPEQKTDTEKKLEYELILINEDPEDG